MLAIESRTPDHPAPLLSLLLLRLCIYTYYCGVIFDSPTSTMERFLSVRPPLPFNDVILALKPINSKADATKEVIKFKLQGKNYIQCNALTKKPKHMKQHMSHLWLWGEDLQLKEGHGSITYYYCYICERLKKPQELPIVSSGGSSGGARWTR